MIIKNMYASLLRWILRQHIFKSSQWKVWF